MEVRVDRNKERDCGGRSERVARVLREVMQMFFRATSSLPTRREEKRLNRD
jgi:hypothetical protein